MEYCSITETLGKVSLGSDKDLAKLDSLLHANRMKVSKNYCTTGMVLTSPQGLSN